MRRAAARDHSLFDWTCFVSYQVAHHRLGEPRSWRPVCQSEVGLIDTCQAAYDARLGKELLGG